MATMGVRKEYRAMNKWSGHTQTTEVTYSVPVRTGFRMTWVMLKCTLWALLHRTTVDIQIGHMPKPEIHVTNTFTARSR